MVVAAAGPSAARAETSVFSRIIFAPANTAGIFAAEEGLRAGVAGGAQYLLQELPALAGVKKPLLKGVTANGTCITTTAAN